MRNLLFVLLLIFNTSFAKDKIRVNIFSNLVGKGLETDARILKETLEPLGCIVKVHHLTGQTKADINIYLEEIDKRNLKLAKVHWFIPNPEHLRRPSKSLLKEMDLILCKTHAAEKALKKSGAKTYFLGFTSPDCYLRDVPKDFTKIAHLPGSSGQKGTNTVIKTWHLHPEFPDLAIVHWDKKESDNRLNLKIFNKRLEESEFRKLQNECGIHLCPSQTEGFGHSIIEAMSTGAVVLTTNAPPMNEFINDFRCLIPYEYASREQKADIYIVNENLLSTKIAEVSQLSIEERRAIGMNNRLKYLKKREEFISNLTKLIKSL